MCVYLLCVYLVCSIVQGVGMDVVQKEEALSVLRPEDSSRTEPLHCSAPVGSSSHCHLCDWHPRICEVGQICIKGMSLCMIFYGKGRYEV